MPTLAVPPDDSESLQAIANALVKARKVVVVTGAGISTNSGIPDFRSENGLYQLIQEQYEAAARTPAPKTSAPEPDNGNPGGAPGGDEFPDDRPRKRQRLDLVDKQETRALPEVMVTHGACAGGEQGTTDGAAAEKEGGAACAVPDTSVPKNIPDDASQLTKLKEDPRRSRAKSLPPSRRRSARLNPEAQDSLVLPEPQHNQTCSHGPLNPQQHRPAQPAGPELPSTPVKTRRRTITTIQPGSSSPLSDAPSEFSSPSRIFDRLSSPRSSSPLSDPPSHLGISSPLSDLRAYLPSSPPLNSRRSHLLSLNSSSPLSSPPQFLVHPYENPRARRSASRENSPSAETREAHPKSRHRSTTTSNSTDQESSPTAEGSAQSGPCGPSYHLSQLSSAEDCGARGAEEIHCAPIPSTRPTPSSSQQPSTGTIQSGEPEQPPSSQPVSSQGSAPARLPLPNIKGRDLFDATIWACPVRTSVFYTFATTLRQKVRDVTPTSSHLFIGHLRDRGKLVRCYTQNIDRIEEKVGLSTALDRGPGHRSRFSRRAPALSRVNSGATDAAAADTGLYSSGLGGQGELSSSNATDTSDSPHDQQKAAHKGRDDGGPEGPGEGRPDPNVSGAVDGTAADGTRTRGPDASSGHSDNSSGAGSSQGNPGTAGRPNAAGTGLQRVSAHAADDAPTPKRDGPRAANDTSASAATGVPGTTGQPAIEATETPASSQEGPGDSEAGPAAANPKDRQRQSSPSSGVECVFLHGSLECLRCFRCRRVCEWEGREEQTFFGQQPECPHCAGATAAREERGKRALGVGKLRPDIVLYGEEHPNAHLISPVVTHDLGLAPDLLLILGTSLKVHGLKVLVRQFAKAVHSRGGKVVFVNFTKPPESSWGDIIDYWVAWDCDAWVGDLKEKAPTLWLPPGEEAKKRKSINTKGVEKKTGEKKTAAAKKTGAAGGKKSGSKKDDKAGEEIVVSSQESTTTQVATELTSADMSICASQEAAATISAPDFHDQPPGHRKPQAHPQDKPQESRPKQQRVALREDKINGAYFMWKIMDSLRGISGRAAPPAMELPSVVASRAIAAADASQAKRDRKRRSTVAAGRADEQIRGPPVEARMPEVWSIHSSAPAVRQDGTGPRKMIFPPLRPSLQDNPGAATRTKRESLPVDMHHARTPTPKPSRGPPPDTSMPARVDPRKRKLACLQSPAPLELRPPRHPGSPPSILSAVKSNPRKRKRKTIDGEEVVLPSVGSRRLSPSSDKENTEARRLIPALSEQPMDGTPIRLPPLRGAVGGGRKPAPMEPVSSPEGPAVTFESGRRAARGAERVVDDPFCYQSGLQGLVVYEGNVFVGEGRGGGDAEDQAGCGEEFCS